jgi:ankyrin repeat protein
MVTLLLDHGADVYARNYKGVTSLLCAVQSGSLPMVKIIVSHATKKEQQKILNKAKLYHLTEYNPGFYATLAQTKPEIINVANNVDMTPLIYAAAWGFNDIADYLIQHGADVNKAGEDGLTALHFAAQYGSATIIEMLIANGANINAQTSGGQTALMHAVREGFESIVRSLINHGANTELEDDQGYTLTFYTKNHELRETILDMITGYKYQQKHDEL